MFPLALAALDPLIWTSLWNSVAVAVIVAVGSLVTGVTLGGVAARFRVWGRPLLSAWITAPAVVAPALFALGLLGLFDPSGQDAARLAGARPLRVWWTLTWPTLRPSVASAVYLVFMINLADPAAPLVLGLRRTLGFQMV